MNNISESVLKLDPHHALRLVDWFTPSNCQTLDANDLDFTSSGPMILPGTSLLVGGGKTGVLYLLKSIDLGKHTDNDSGAVQKLQISTGELHGGPVYWQRSAANGGSLLYDWGADDVVKSFRFEAGSFLTTPVAKATTHGFWPGGILALSANGDTPGTGVLRATVPTAAGAENTPPVSGALYAFDAGNVATELWNSSLDATRDKVGNFAKFVPPVIANGRVYVATWSKQILVYGLLD